MNTHKRYTLELKERAVKMVLDHSAEYQSEWQAVCSIAGKFGMTPETLRKWVRQAERDKELRPGLTTAERERLGQLERENRELYSPRGRR